MRLSTILVASLLSGSMVFAPSVDARGRTNNANANTGNSTAVAPANRPGNNNRPSPPPQVNNGHHGNNNSYRPGNNNHNNNHNNNRPGGNNWNNGNQNNHRPNDNWGNNYRPGGGNNGHNHPGYGNNRPTNPPYHGPNNPRPPRPHFPPSFHYHRPTPPPAWRPAGPVPSFNSILGITLGTALNLTLNALTNNGYSVAGYGSSEIYLSNVNQFNYNWPDASLYFNNGQLVGSSFAYATAGYNMNRYNRLFSTFINMYGNPASVQNLSNGGVRATWWGYNNNYVTLAYYPDYLPTGPLRYFTTVTLGR